MKRFLFLTAIGAGLLIVTGCGRSSGVKTADEAGQGVQATLSTVEKTPVTESYEAVGTVRAKAPGISSIFPSAICQAPSRDMISRGGLLAAPALNNPAHRMRAQIVRTCGFMQSGSKVLASMRRCSRSRQMFFMVPRPRGYAGRQCP